MLISLAARADLMSMENEVIFRICKARVLCEDVRCEFNGMQTLVGVIMSFPLRRFDQLHEACIWTRWCSGSGTFRQKSRIVGVDEQQVIAQAEVEFQLKEMEGHARTFIILRCAIPAVRNASCGIYLADELRLRFPLPVVQ